MGIGGEMDHVMNTAEKMLFEALLAKTDSIADDVSGVKSDIAVLKSDMLSIKDKISCPVLGPNGKVIKIILGALISLLTGAATVGALFSDRF